MRPQVPAHPEDDRLLELAYGEIPASEARALRQHVDGCARCREVLQGIAEVRSAFRSVPTEPAPERGLESLLAYGEQAAARARSRRGGLRILGILSAAVALAIGWLLVPAPHEQEDRLARAPAPAAKEPDAVARLETPRAPAQGDRARDEESPEGPKQPTVASSSGPSEPAKERRKLEELLAPGLRAQNALADAEAKRRDVGKGDAPAEVAARTNAMKDLDRSGSAGASGVGTGTLGVAGGAMAEKKSVGAFQPHADSLEQKASRSGSVATVPPPAPKGADDSRAREAAKLAVPADGTVASAEQAASDVAQAPASQQLAKSAPAAAAAKVGSPTSAAPASRSVQMQSARVGMGTPAQEARLAEIGRKLETAQGDDRKALLLERCELHASLQRGPDAVQSCSQVAREFPGTPEAKRASELARGFSLQLPDQPQR